MKILLSLLFLFSTETFSKELDFSLIGNRQIQKSLVDYPENYGTYHFGIGFNSTTGTVSGKCVNNTRPISVIENGTGKTVSYDTQIIKSETDLYKALSLEAGGSFRFGIGSVSAKGKFASAIQVHNYSLFLLARIEVKFPEKAMTDVTLAQNATDILSTRDLTKFLSTCGDEYVIGITNGASYYVVLEFETKSHEEQRLIESELSGSLSEVFSSSVAFAQKFSKVFKFENTKVHTYQEGGVVGKHFNGKLRLPKEIEEFATYIAEFPSGVTSENAIPLKARTQTYDTITPIIFELNNAVQNQRDVLNILQERRLHYLSALSNYDFILQDAGIFETPEFQKINEEKVKAIDLLNKAGKYAVDCSSNIDFCIHHSELINLRPFSPKNLAANFNCEMKGIEICGIEKTEMVTDEKLCGSSIEVKQDQKCGVQNYNAREHQVCGNIDINNGDVLISPITYKQMEGAPCGPAAYNSRKSGSKCGYHSCVGLIPKCKPRECNHPDFGVARWNACRDESFGVERYPICRKKEFGPEIFKTCEVRMAKTCKKTTYNKCWTLFSTRSNIEKMCPLFAIPNNF